MSETVEVVGWVRWYRRTLGYGFVVPPDGGPDVFVHAGTLKAHGVQRLYPSDIVRCVARPRERRGRLMLEAVHIIEVQRRPQPQSAAAALVKG